MTEVAQGQEMEQAVKTATEMVQEKLSSMIREELQPALQNIERRMMALRYPPGPPYIPPTPRPERERRTIRG